MPFADTARFRSAPSLALAAAVLAGALFIDPVTAKAETASNASMIAARLKAGYPGIVTSVADNTVVFADGAHLTLDDGNGDKSFAAWLSQPDIEDMFAQTYPWHARIAPPARNFDPGRARNSAFFNKVYGNCRNGQVARSLVSIPWLPKKFGKSIRVSGKNRVAKAFAAVSRELDVLPAKFNKHLARLGGTYNCRAIAGTGRLSAHAYGIAIDIAPERAGYWRWNSGDFKNTMPAEIVAAFEKHGFIWGGRWYHYDTMHFEYRPELR